MTQQTEKSERPDRLSLKLSPGKRLLRPFLALLLRAFFRFYGRWQVLGLENVPRTGPVIFAGNHVSLLDPPMGWAALYGVRTLWGLARESLWKSSLVGYFVTAINGLPLKRGTADKAVLKLSLNILRQGEAIGIFPEGTRSPDGKLLPAHPGVAFIALKSGAPVIPIAMIGTFEMLPRKAKGLKRSRLKIVFGRPIVFEEGISREAAAQQIMTEIAKLMTSVGHPMEPPGPERQALADSLRED